MKAELPTAADFMEWFKEQPAEIKESLLTWARQRPAIYQRFTAALIDAGEIAVVPNDLADSKQFTEI